MPTLGWNEIQQRAIRFVKEWEDETNENAEAKSFLDDFFNVFGITRRRVATFETRVKKINGKDGFIDMLWKGKILIEMKSKGKDLDKAYGQATDYFEGLKEHELPRYILVCDFENFRLYDLENERQWDFKINEFPKKIKLFGFIIGYVGVEYKVQTPVNIKAAEKMGELHDKLKEIGYDGHQLEVYLVRILFCLFSDDTRLFEPNQFYDYISSSSEDGNDLAMKIARLFQILNTSYEKRLKSLPEELLNFPYINGGLFEEQLEIADFTGEMREILLNCGKLDWYYISPSIFGSMFQSIMNPKERRNLGVHYTSENNIIKVIKPLFLDSLYEEFEKIRHNKNKLEDFHIKISNMKFLDPACGCGNFLIIVYRELRELELLILKSLHENRVLNIDIICKVNVNQFYGIEYEEFPVQIGRVAMWLVDHQMNMKISDEFGKYYARIPLLNHANIIHENALTYDWKDLIKPQALSYILGNPPFHGAAVMSSKQKNEVMSVFNNLKGSGRIDYVTAWYKKSVEFIQGTEIEVALVSTNSICQGEQVIIFWKNLFLNYDLSINFAHKTFKWKNEAPGVAAVYCIIVGFSCFDRDKKHLYNYETPTSNPDMVKVKNINAYLVNGSNTIVDSRTKPLCNIPKMLRGSSPVDGGAFNLTEDEKNEIESLYPQITPYIKKYIGAVEFINQTARYCLWLENISPKIIQQIPELKKRLEQVKRFRLESKKEATRKLADFPTVFADNRHTGQDYVLIPRHSSEKRKYIPIGFMSKDYIASDAVQVIPNADIYHFAILTSKMHMVWTNYTCGRLKNDFRYSNIVYNNFPWPAVTKKEKESISRLAKNILDVRELYKGNSLAQLYDPLMMPPDLLKVHNKLDRAIDKLYSKKILKNDSERMSLLLSIYENLTNNK